MSTTPIPKPSVRTDQPVAALLQSVWLAIVGAFGLRVFLCLLSHRMDSKSHLGLQVIGREAGFIAWSLASGKGFANPFPGYNLVTGWLAPVFPFLWSIGLRIFNPNYGNGGIYFCQVMNSAFSALTCWPIYWLGKKLFSRKMGLAASWAWVFMPLAILFPLEWAWDQSLSALVLMLLLCATYKLREYPAVSLAWAGYGVMWGFAALVNPTLCGMLPFLLAWLAYQRWNSGAASFRPLLKATCFFLLCILPWTARNYFKLDGLVFIKSNFGLELWLGNNPAVPADAVYSSQLHPMNNYGEFVELVLSGEPGYMAAKRRAALAFIRANPGTFLDLLGRRVLDTWAGVYDSREDKWITALHLRMAEIYFCVALSLFSLAGMILALRKSAGEVLPLALCAVVFPIPYYITHTSLRYRHPIDPILTLFATYAIAQIISAINGRRKPIR
ncbi:MAG TPA: glycosyltransferase family 39 protein [Candidatus Dormibacteraeota bacterium]|nr:glycosyltransferase family 39 protein [Candidatus Dormibacteraeota bacterium]